MAPDMQMNLDFNSNYIGESETLYLKQIYLLAGKVKLHADKDWGLNYGGTGLNGTLKNIVINTDDYYDVEFDLSSMTYSIITLSKADSGF